MDISMDGKRVIFHIDVNSAFLSWSALKRLEEEPNSIDLRTVPSAVGGDVATRHGVITAKSIPAKQFGIQTGEPVITALRKCSHLILVKSDFKTYRKYSAQFIAILREYTDRVQQVSIDEAFLDVTDLVRERGGLLSSVGDKVTNGVSSPADGRDWKHEYSLQLADTIKNDIRTRLGFTVNVGISENKFLAKMASDFKKPDRIHTLFPEEIPAKLWPLPVRDLYGCGRATTQKLNQMGFQTIGEVAACDEALLRSILGEKHGTYLHERANGRDDSPVVPEKQEAKSYSNEMTTAEDIDRQNYDRIALPLISKLSGKVSQRLRRDGVRGSTICVMVKTGEFQRYSRQITIQHPTNEQAEIEQTARELMQRLLFTPGGLFSKGQVLRLVGIGVSGLEEGGSHQMELGEWMEINEKQQQRKGKLDNMMKQIREKYGDASIRKGNFGKDDR